MHRKCIIDVFHVVWTYSPNDSEDDFLIPLPWKHHGQKQMRHSEFEEQGQRHSEFEEHGQRHSEFEEQGRRHSEEQGRRHSEEQVRRHNEEQGRRHSEEQERRHSEEQENVIVQIRCGHGNFAKMFHLPYSTKLWQGKTSPIQSIDEGIYSILNKRKTSVNLSSNQYS